MSSIDVTLSGPLVETHSYDGTIGEIVRKECATEYYDVKKLTKEEVGSSIAWFFSRLKTHDAFDPVASYWFGEVSKIDEPQNFDSVNDLDASHMLLLCWRLYYTHQSSDLIPVLCEQLRDIQKGPCPQGRTTRLFQAYILMKQSLET